MLPLDEYGIFNRKTGNTCVVMRVHVAAAPRLNNRGRLPRRSDKQEGRNDYQRFEP